MSDLNRFSLEKQLLVDMETLPCIMNTLSCHFKVCINKIIVLTDKYFWFKSTGQLLMHVPNAYMVLMNDVQLPAFGLLMCSEYIIKDLYKSKSFIQQ